MLTAMSHFNHIYGNMGMRHGKKMLNYKVLMVLRTLIKVWSISNGS
jgi:hypothetical protein